MPQEIAGISDQTDIIIHRPKTNTLSHVDICNTPKAVVRLAYNNGSPPPPQHAGEIKFKHDHRVICTMSA